MQLHDLDLARFDLRMKRLNQMLAEQAFASETANAADTAGSKSAVADATVFLEPPLPPRLEVETGDNEIRGNPGAPVTIIEFLDFQSPHSSRMQPLLQQILEDYGPLVRLIARDLPLRYHRYAQQAAEAAECARRQGSFWRYHDLLLHNQERLDQSGLMHLASTPGLELEKFETCLATGAGAAAVQEDADAAQKLGLQTTPTYFINGLYLRGTHSYSYFARLINLELARLGILGMDVIRTMGIDQCPLRLARRSTLPLSLTGTVAHDNPVASAAVLQDPTSGTILTLKPGDEIAGDTRLVLVAHDRAYLQHGDQLEFLPLSGSGDEVTPRTPDPVQSSPADAVLVLRRTEIDRALEESDRPEATLATGSMDIEGKRLLKLTEADPGGLFDLLGLRARDVLMQVDGKWIHNRHNPLWNALRTRDRVTLTIMRKGFPKTFQYVIKEDRQ